MGYKTNKTKGQMIYVPPVIIDELQDLQREDDIPVRAEAFKKLVKYAQVGRETKRLITFGYDWGKKKKRHKGGLF